LLQYDAIVPLARPGGTDFAVLRMEAPLTQRMAHASGGDSVMLLARQPTDYAVLIADDDPGSRDCLREIVEPQGFRTLVAESGEEAIEVVQSEPVHLFLCDMYMPKLTGLEVLELVRQVNQCLPFILISGDVDDQLMRKALQAKAYSVLAKPVSKSVLLYTVIRALVRAYEAEE
jgi:CheY-like chemotaxis protein